MGSNLLFVNGFVVGSVVNREMVEWFVVEIVHDLRLGDDREVVDGEIEFVEVGEVSNVAFNFAIADGKGIDIFKVAEGVHDAIGEIEVRDFKMFGFDLWKEREQGVYLFRC